MKAPMKLEKVSTQSMLKLGFLITLTSYFVICFEKWFVLQIWFIHPKSEPGRGRVTSYIWGDIAFARKYGFSFNEKDPEVESSSEFL